MAMEPKFIFTQVRGADAVWFKGMLSFLRVCGGGRLVPCKKGVHVFAYDPMRLYRHLEATYNYGNTNWKP